MIRTKDLVLFAVTIVFLTMAILVTLVHEQSRSPLPTQVTFGSVPTEDSLSASYTARELDRQSIIARLRAAIKDADTTISAPVTVVHTIEPNADDTASSSEPGAVVVQNRCPEQNDALSFARSWPREGVVVQAAEGVRLVAVVGTAASVQTAASSTVSTPPVAVRSLATLPLAPQLSNPQCLSSEIIGVTTDGALMFNSDAIAYYTKGTDTLLGYARDGVPIYGVYHGTTDECGGYTSPTGYRYSVSPERNFIIGCYHANPVAFSGE